MGTQAGEGDYAQAVADFASELTTLRHRSNLTVQALADQAEISRTSVITALSGQELPSPKIVVAIAAACNVADAPLVARRNQIARMKDAPVGRPVKRQQRSVPWWWVPIAAVGGISVGCASVLIVGQVIQGLEPTRPAVVVSTGEDPASTECLDDVAVAADRTTDDLYLLEVLYSNRCSAGWARVTRYDHAEVGNTIMVRVYPRDAPEGPDAQEATEHDVQNAYTALLVRPTPQTLLCAAGSVSIEGRQVEIEPLCT